MQTTKVPRFIRITGRSGAGKTTWAMNRARSLGKDHRLFVIDTRSGYEQLAAARGNALKAETILFDISKGITGSDVERQIQCGHIGEQSTLIVDEFQYVAKSIGEPLLKKIMLEFIGSKGSIIVADQSESSAFFDGLNAQLGEMDVAEEHIRLGL